MKTTKKRHFIIILYTQIFGIEDEKGLFLTRHLVGPNWWCWKPDFLHERSQGATDWGYRGDFQIFTQKLSYGVFFGVNARGQKWLKYPISQLLGKNSKIASVAPVSGTIWLFMQKIRLLAPLVWSDEMPGRKSLLIFYFEDSCKS